MCECNMCGLSKVRQDGKRRPDSRGFYKVDGQGRRWNGRTCPECRSDETGVRGDFGPAEPLNPPKLRRCSGCSTMSPNYFKCPPCTSHAKELGCLNTEMYYIEEVHVGAKSYKAGFHY